MWGKRFCKRPWGWWLVLLHRKHFKIKLLYFKKGQSLSRQIHYYRGELWLFLKGVGSFYSNGRKEMRKGSFINVPPLSVHQFTAHRPTLVLEVQYGEECDENDIVRLSED